MNKWICISLSMSSIDSIKNLTIHVFSKSEVEITMYANEETTPETCTEIYARARLHLSYYKTQIIKRQ